MARQTIDNKWGSAGTAIDPGAAKINAGWGAEIPPFETQNFWQLRVDDILQNAEKNGFIEYDAATTYSIGSWVKASDNESYKSKTTANTGNDPVSSPLNWDSFTSLITSVDATETVKGIAELATLAETQNGTDDTRIVTPKKLKDSIQQIVPDASTSTKGKVELTSNSEAQTGTDTTRAVTAAALASVTSTETRAGLVERATDAEVTNGTDTIRYVSVKQVSDRINVLVPAATETIQGKIEIATQSEVDTGADDTKAVTPKKLDAYSKKSTFSETTLFSSAGISTGNATLSQVYTNFDALVFLTSRGTTGRSVTHLPTGMIETMRTGGLKIELTTMRGSTSNPFLTALPTSTSVFAISESDEGTKLLTVVGITY